mmetsp:Transcript_8813/g.18632  ORF Transcript_8813/g.18632 Transcript_8813/m.18632 type:complete len:212 (-) Transcript_8813:1149-1784(-)
MHHTSRRSPIQRIPERISTHPIVQSILHQQRGVGARGSPPIRKRNRDGRHRIAISRSFETRQHPDLGGGNVALFRPPSSSRRDRLEQFGTTRQLLAVADHGDVTAGVDVRRLGLIARAEEDQARVVDVGGTRERHPVLAALDGSAFVGLALFQPVYEGWACAGIDAGFRSRYVRCCCICALIFGGICFPLFARLCVVDTIIVVAIVPLGPG